jgi:hypothetical protein
MYYQSELLIHQISLSCQIGRESGSPSISLSENVSTLAARSQTCEQSHNLAGAASAVQHVSFLSIVHHSRRRYRQPDLRLTDDFVKQLNRSKCFRTNGFRKREKPHTQNI